MPKAKTWEEYKTECEAVTTLGVTILGYIGEWKGANTKLKCLCDKHGEWCSTRISHFKRGHSCPGCMADLLRERNSGTWEEYFPRIKVIADAKGYTIEGHGVLRGNKTKLRLVCPVHGEFNGTNIKAFLGGNGCPMCGQESRRESKLLSDDTHVGAFMSSGKFKEGTTFKRNTHKVDSQGVYSYWDYICPVCSDDEYVRAGVCSGVFTASTSTLRYGKLACRCSTAYRFTKPQWEYRLTKECERRGYVFIGWKGRDWGTKAKFTYKCLLHGEQNKEAGSFLSGSGCPVCAGYNQRECYLNVVKDGNLPIALKLGISRESNIRLKKQNSRNRLSMEQMVLYMFPTAEQCKSAERYCKKTLKRGVVSKQDMPDGWTETVALTDYDKVVSIYERFGGVRVDTLTKEAV